MKYLNYKLNKDINNIICNYLDQSEEHLIKVFNKSKYINKSEKEFVYGRNLLDLISRAIQTGCAGICIPNENRKAIGKCYSQINLYILKYIATANGVYHTFFYIKKCGKQCREII